MPTKFQNVQQNFGGGVLSPRWSTRVDLDVYAHALKEAKNWIITKQGGAVMREGHEFISYSAANSPFRIFQFLRGGEISDILVEVNAGVIRFWIDDGGTPSLYADLVTVLHDEDDGELLFDEADGEFLTIGVITAPNPYSVDDLAEVYFTNQDRFAILTHPTHPTLYITFQVDGTVLVEPFPKEKIPYFDYPDVDSPINEAQAADWYITFPNSWSQNEYAYKTMYNNKPSDRVGTYVYDDPDGNAGELQQMLQSASDSLGYSASFNVDVVNLTTYEVNITGPDAGWGVDIYPTYGYNTGSIAFGPVATRISGEDGDVTSDPVDEPAWSYPQYVLHNSGYWRCIRTHRSSAASEPNVGSDWELYWAYEGIGVPVGFDYQFPDGNAWDVNDVLYSPMGRGFPAVCQFHEQRLILMANPDNPTAMYGSAIGGFQQFTPGPNDDQPWLFVLDSSDTPEIKWAISERNLLLGTSSGDWLITARVTITPTDIQATRQNASRSKRTKPIQIDTEVVYIEQGGRTLKGTQYNDNIQSFSSADISALAEHLISTHGVSRIVIQHTPEILMTGVRNNGQAITLTYDKHQRVIAYTEFETDGEVYDVAAFFSEPLKRDHTYYSVLRNGNWCLERMRYPCSKICEPLTENDIVCLDGWVKRYAQGTVLEGLGHLEGKTVTVLHGDAKEAGEFKVSGGRVQLPEPRYGIYAVGLPYEAKLVTFEMDDIRAGMTGLGTRRRWLKLWTRILNSALPKVYDKLAPDRTPATPMGEAETVRPGLQDISQSVSGFGNGSITVIQDEPYPTHVVGFFGEYQVEDR